MYEEIETGSNGFLSASQLMKIKRTNTLVWDDLEESENALPEIGHKYFEPKFDSWLQDKQIEKGLKNRKRALEIERVERLSQLALAEWLPGIQKARVTKKSGLKWENFGHEEKMQMYLVPEEALLLVEMNSLELSWNGMPMSIQQAYEVLINSKKSQCTLDEYRVYSQLVRRGYRLQRYRDKSLPENKLCTTPKRIIMNPDGLWSPKIPASDKKSSDSNGSTSNEKSKLRIGIISEETILGNIKIIKNTNLATPKEMPAPAKETPATSASQPSDDASKWSNSRIQRNVKLMPKRTDILNRSNSSDKMDQSSTSIVPGKRKLSDDTESICSKKSRGDHDYLIIDISDDEIEEIPRPLSRMEILNTLPNLAQSSKELIAQLPRAYLPKTVKPTRDLYRYDRYRLLNYSQTDDALARGSSMDVVPMSNFHQTGQFYPQGRVQPSQQQQQQAAAAITAAAYNANNGYSYGGMASRCQRGGNNSYIQQNVSHNTIHNPYLGTVYQSSNHVNFVMEVMGSMVRSYRQQQFQTTFCQNLQINYPGRYSYHHPQQQQHNRYPYALTYNNYNLPYSRDQYTYRRNAPPPSSSFVQRNRVFRQNGNDTNFHFTSRPNLDDLNLPSFSKRPNASSWSDLKKKWREESTITIEDEEPTPVEVKKPTYNRAATSAAAAKTTTSPIKNYNTAKNDNDSTDITNKTTTSVANPSGNTAASTSSGTNAAAAAASSSASSSEVQVVEKDDDDDDDDDDESVKPLINSKRGISNLSEVYERLRVIKSAANRTIRLRKVDYTLSYDVYPPDRPYKKSAPGTPLCRLYVTNVEKEAFLEPSKIRRLQQESRDAPVIVAFVSQSCISYVQQGVVLLPNFT